jgi:two-component system, LytTR family, response regulator
MRIRSLVVDDEALARRRLSHLLSLEADFEVVGQCADGNSAVDEIVRLKPDLLFLDVQMPGMNGFDVLEAVGSRHAPSIIFVTAYDSFAVKAFDAHAIDYLLKPFRRARFQASLERVRQGRLARAPQVLASFGPTSDRMVVRSGDRLLFVPFEELEYVRAAANYVQLHMGREVCLVRETITAMESRLPRERFVRIHRSYIVNLAAVHDLSHAGGGEYLLSLRSGGTLPVGPSYPAVIRTAFARVNMPRIGTFGGL